MDKLSLHGKRVLVTGGNGYLGTHLVTALKKEQAIVFILDKTVDKSKTSFNVDITNRNEVVEAVQKIQPEFIFHLAASLNRERNYVHFDQISDVNYQGTLNLLLALKDDSYHNFIFTSTSEVYGGNKTPFNEKQIPQPVSPYSLTKLNAENLIKNFSELNNKPFTILRVFNFFGKNMPKDFFIPQLINDLRVSNTFEMTEGEQKRDFLHVDDVVQALLLSATNRNARNELFNVSTGTAVTLKQLAMGIHAKLNSKCNIKFGALPYRENEVWDMVGDNTKIKKALEFNVTYDLHDAIDELIDS